MAYFFDTSRVGVVSLVATLAFVAACGSSDTTASPGPLKEDAGPDAAPTAAPDGGGDGAPKPFEPVVLGQPSATTNEGVRLGLALPNDVIFVGSRLIVADQNNSRVLIWNDAPTANHEQADVVIGQPDFSTSVPDYGGMSARGFRGSNGIASDGTHLVVADRFNHRVLIWNTFPSQNFVPADVVLGQPDFTTNESNTGGISATSLTEPMVWIGGGKLFVADRSNFRVLIWNTIPTSNHAPADVVLGQPDMTSATVNNGGLTASAIADPMRGWVDGTRLFVPDLGNQRVLIWNTIPTTNNAPADLVLGQPSMTVNGPNAGGAPSASGFGGPISVYASGNTVAVADYVNNRVLVWSSPITANGQAAGVIIGQKTATDVAANAGGVTASSLSAPDAVAGDGTKLAISDRFNNRVLLFPTLPTTTGASASLVLGQSDLVSSRGNNGGPVSASTFGDPMGLTQAGQGLALADYGNARVLIWKALPDASSDVPDLVLGQPDFTSFQSAGGSTSAQTLCGPQAVTSDGTRFAVGEQCARRVTIWNALPTSNHQAADVVAGQPDMTTSTQNTGGVSASSMGGRPQPCLDGERMIVADPNNNRVLIWNTIPTSTGSAANLVLGQPDMAAAAPNNGGVSAASLSLPISAVSNGQKLLVADSNNHRVLIWNTIPTSNQAPADVVLGQANMTSQVESPPSSRTLRTPRAIHVDKAGRLYVADNGDHRVVYWNAIPTQSNAPADGVLGQPNLGEALPNNGGLTARTLQGPSGVVAIDDRVYIADSGNSRIVILPKP
jgi:hypothetical protein